MTQTTHLTKNSAYLRASMYYIILWGSLATASSFIAVDLNHRGVTELQWSIISAARSLVIFLATPLVTRFADRKNARVRVLQGALVLNALSTLLFMIPNGFTGFLLASLVMNLFGAGMMPLGDGIIVRMAHKHDIQFGRLRLWGSAGYMICGVLGGLLWDKIGFEYLYWIGCLATLLVAVVAARLEEPGEEKNELQSDAPSAKPLEPTNKKTISQILRGDVVLLLFLIASLLRSTGELMFFNFSGIYIDQLTARPFFTGLINGGSAILEIPTMLFVQRWIKKFGLEPVILIGFIIQAAGLAIFAFSTNPWIMFLGASLRNVGFALYFVAAVQFTDYRAGVQNSATYQGLLSSISWGLAPLIISPLAGWIYQHLQGQWVFILATITSILAAIVMIPIMARSSKEKKEKLQLS